MIQKKICMLGAMAAGKTSLVQQFVKSIFSEKYLTTVGVKIDKKLVEVDGEQLNLILWDLHGEDEFQKIRNSYLRGSSGYLLVVDGTRPDTLKRALSIQKTTEEIVGQVPFILLLNKIDLTNEWELDDRKLRETIKKEWTVIKTSARTGQGVEEAFFSLAKRMREE